MCNHDVIQDEIGSLKTRFGQPLSHPKRLGTKANDMSQAGLQILQLELDNLHAERAQRERKLDMLLGRLRKACVELDEDDSAAAAAAHPSLQHHRCAPFLLQSGFVCMLTLSGTLKVMLWDAYGFKLCISLKGLDNVQTAHKQINEQHPSAVQCTQGYGHCQN